MPQTLSRVAERVGLTSEQFHEQVLAAGRPVVLRGLVKDWPVVRAGASPAALAAYIKPLDRGHPVGALFGGPGIGGRFHYNEDLSGFNYRQGQIQLSAALDLLADYAREDRPPSLAVQSVPVRQALAGFEAENPMPLLGDAVEPRVWIGNAVTVAAHHDPSENIACVVAGKRRFTLFPPEQVANLYMGPLELTPAGAAISMVDFDAPDLVRFPRFAEAMKQALVVDLEPGDALYIPYLWWHHVRSTERLNMLVNYWWTPSDPARGRPIEAMMHAMLAVRDLPPGHRAAWKVMFDHHVFHADDETAAHLPPRQRGILGRMDGPMIRAIRAGIARTLGRA
ncbi:MAG: cupin-like domain-containing protein [Brevundimonas sp.]|nr:MAG: cupin-like domain-containing protein [Brevundimonas sp.]